jgi:hypothetical protein
MRTLQKLAAPIFMLFALLFSFGAIAPVVSAQVSVGIGISVHTAPPPLPVYTQPIIPGPGYIWTPGYWAYGPVGYYWVPGVWVMPPRVGVLWTPGYWGFGAGVYGWHPGYWGPHVGFYGGINYGFGYGGVGFAGGMWAGSVFRYNSAVTNVNTSITRNVYVDRTVVNNTTVMNHASFNGTGGVVAQARPEELSAGHEEHFQPTSNQVSHEQAMSHDRNQLNSFNHGTPGTAAMDRVDGRRFNQQGRIAQGIGSGQLTPAETKNIESREARVNGEIHNDRAANGGTLTPVERQQVNRQQNNMSRSIYNDKHNAAAQQYGNTEAGQRRYNQEQRIANGVNSGQMSPSEAARAENHEQNINRNIAGDRAANGGKLTPQERRNVNRQQNQASRQIYRGKHNEKMAPR